MSRCSAFADWPLKPHPQCVLDEGHSGKHINSVLPPIRYIAAWERSDGYWVVIRCDEGGGDAHNEVVARTGSEKWANDIALRLNKTRTMDEAS